MWFTGEAVAKCLCSGYRHKHCETSSSAQPLNATTVPPTPPPTPLHPQISYIEPFWSNVIQICPLNWRRETNLSSNFLGRSSVHVPIVTSSSHLAAMPTLLPWLMTAVVLLRSPTPSSGYDGFWSERLMSSGKQGFLKQCSLCVAV